MRELHLDVESYSAIDLTVVGAHVYFAHPTTDLWCAAYAFDNEEPLTWQPGDPCPEEIEAHVREGGIITAWNAAFERLACAHLLGPKYGWPQPSDRQFRCTMTESFAMNLPGKLDLAGRVLGLKMQKDEAGSRLMKQMCKPRKPRKGEIVPEGTPTYKNDKGHPLPLLWHDSPEKRAILTEYCAQDVRTEAEAGEKLMRLKQSELQLYFLDMKINDRGVYLDKKLLESAQIVVDRAMDNLNAEMNRVTGGEVRACSNVAMLKQYLEDRFVYTESLDKEHIEDLLIREDLPDNCRRALELRQEGSKTSTSKIATMLARRQQDGRMRGNLQFYGAGATGRWAARGAQLQNLTRPSILKKKKGGKPVEALIETAIDAIHSRSAVMLELMYGRPLTVVADCVRSMICAAPGNILRASDFSNIEGRVLAWEADQEDKLERFVAQDNGTGPDGYLVTAAGIYNVPLADVDDDKRQIGKVAELSLGYQGGVRAFAKMSKNYGVRIGQLFGPIWEMSEDRFKNSAEETWDKWGHSLGMTRPTYLAAEVIKLAWRDQNYRIVEYWGEVERAAVAAVKHPGEIFTAPKVKFRKYGPFLHCLLPSGRAICYPYAKLQEKKMPWGDMRETIVYKMPDEETRQWFPKNFYGGLGVENITQAIARDIMAEAMVRVDKAGYNVVLTVHDEVVSETPEDFGSLEEFNELMAQMPRWTNRLPLTVAGWEGQRYRKG